MVSVTSRSSVHKRSPGVVLLETGMQGHIGRGVDAWKEAGVQMWAGLIQTGMGNKVWFRRQLFHIFLGH
jgi:hypothetical protein